MNLGLNVIWGPLRRQILIVTHIGCKGGTFQPGSFKSTPGYVAQEGSIMGTLTVRKHLEISATVWQVWAVRPKKKKKWAHEQNHSIHGRQLQGGKPANVRCVWRREKDQHQHGCYFRSDSPVSGWLHHGLGCWHITCLRCQGRAGAPWPSFISLVTSSPHSSIPLPCRLPERWGFMMAHRKLWHSLRLLIASASPETALLISSRLSLMATPLLWLHRNGGSGRPERTEEPPGQEKQCRVELTELDANSSVCREIKSELEGLSVGQKRSTRFSHIKPTLVSLVIDSDRRPNSKSHLASLKLHPSENSTCFHKTGYRSSLFLFKQ